MFRQLGRNLRYRGATVVTVLVKCILYGQKFCGCGNHCDYRNHVNKRTMCLCIIFPFLFST